MLCVVSCISERFLSKKIFVEGRCWLYADCTPGANYFISRLILRLLLSADLKLPVFLDVDQGEALCLDKTTKIP